MMSDEAKLVLAGIGTVALVFAYGIWDQRRYIPGTYILRDEYRTRPHWTDEARWDRRG